MYDIFVISPYTHTDPDIERERVIQTEAFLAGLTIGGGVAYSTIVAMHHLTEKYELPADYSFWQHHCRTMISCAREVYVLCLDGWKESVGVSDEIRIANDLNKDIKYIEKPLGASKEEIT